MKKWYNKLFLNDIRKSIEKYHMIENGDKVLVGLSGGKDSIFLLYSLLHLRRYSHMDFEIIGTHIDIGIGINMEDIKYFCKEEGIPFIYENINITEKIFNQDEKGFNG